MDDLVWRNNRIDSVPPVPYYSVGREKQLASDAHPPGLGFLHGYFIQARFLDGIRGFSFSTIRPRFFEIQINSRLQHRRLATANEFRRWPVAFPASSEECFPGEKPECPVLPTAPDQPVE